MKKPIIEFTKQERDQYAECNQIIKNTKGALIKLGDALRAVRDKRLYRQEYLTFEDYCKKKWGWGKAHGYRLIEASVIKEDIKNLSPHGDKIETEAQARALSGISGTAGRVKALKVAVKSGDVSPTGLKRAAAQLSRDGEIIELDKTGYRVPGPALEYWSRSPEVEEMVNLLRRVRGRARELQHLNAIGKPDLMYVEVDMQGVIMDLENAIRSLKNAVPHAVCSVCQGQLPKNCTFCKGRGVVSQFRWTTVPEELKQIRDATNKKNLAKQAGKNLAKASS